MASLLMKGGFMTLKPDFDFVVTKLRQAIVFTYTYGVLNFKWLLDTKARRSAIRFFLR